MHKDLKDATSSFYFFCLWFVHRRFATGAAAGIEVVERYVEKWFEFYNKLFVAEKVIKVEKEKGIGYSTFMAFYIFYLALKKENSKIIVVEKTKQVSHKVSLFCQLLKTNGHIEVLGEPPKQITRTLKFNNGSVIQTLNPTTYNLNVEDEIEFIFFEEEEIKNTEKFLHHIDIAFTSSNIKKMILTVKNNLDKTYPDIHKIKLK